MNSHILIATNGAAEKAGVAGLNLARGLSARGDVLTYIPVPVLICK
jgi:hypothetical protein